LNSSLSTDLYFLKPCWMVEFIRIHSRPDVHPHHFHSHVFAEGLKSFQDSSVTAGGGSETAGELVSLFDSPITKRARCSNHAENALTNDVNADCKEKEKVLSGGNSGVGVACASGPPSVLPQPSPQLPPHHHVGCSAPLAGRRGRVIRMESKDDEGKDSEERDMPLRFVDIGQASSSINAWWQWMVLSTY
jgi:hypothetical protein